MGVLDIIIAVIVLLGLWRGFKVGLIRSMVSLVGWFIALVAATRFADDAVPFLTGVVDSPVLQMGLGFLIIVLIVMVVMQLIGLLIVKIVEGLNLGFIDKIAGGVLGAAKSILVVLILLSISSPVLVRLPLWQSSILAPELMLYAPFAQKFATEVLGDAWKQIDGTNESIETNDTLNNEAI